MRENISDDESCVEVYCNTYETYFVGLFIALVDTRYLTTKTRFGFYFTSLFLSFFRKNIVHEMVINIARFFMNEIRLVFVFCCCHQNRNILIYKT